MGKRKPKIGIVVPRLDVVGGIGQFVLRLIKALREAEMRVSVYTIEKAAWHKFAIVVDDLKSYLPDEEHYLLPFSFPRLRVLSKLLVTLAYPSKSFPDLLINAAGDLTLIPSHIVYIHASPLMLYVNQHLIIDPRQLEVSSIRKAISLEIYSLYQRLSQKMHRKTLFLTNSKFSKQLLRIAGIRAHVLYPPVDVEQYLKVSTTPIRSRKKLVVTISRFATTKNLDLVPEIARHVPDVEFVIAGSVSYGSMPVIRRLKSRIRELKLRNVRLIFNPTKTQLLDLLQRARLYLHTMFNEHFGIAVVEAMAAGVVPLVHRSGGPWIDLLEQREGVYGFSYTSAEDASETINQVIDDISLLDEISRRCVKKSAQFSFETFRERVKRVISLALSRLLGDKIA